MKMPITESARGIKEIENRMFGLNKLISIYFTNEEVYRYQHDQLMISGPHDASLKLELALVANRNRTLLWTCADMGDGCFLFTFGYDLHVGNEKIGHGSLVQGATIAGEIRRNGSLWTITNESGAWGAMGGANGKTAKLNELADILNRRLNIRFVAQRAFSRYGWKRKIQEFVR